MSYQPPAVLHERGQQIKTLRGKGNRRAVARKLTLPGIQPDV
jgi:hypothetical protein